MDSTYLSNPETTGILERTIKKYPALHPCEGDILSAYQTIIKAYSSGKKLLTCGNGGSAADAEHIVGELMKGFEKKRPPSNELEVRMHSLFGDEGRLVFSKLQTPLRAIALTGQLSLSTAFLNDVSADCVFAQQVFGYGDEGDVLVAISTSGNSKNVINAAIVAKTLGMKVIALTGDGGGLLRGYADTTISVPCKNTAEAQELHLPVYHCLCLMVEAYFFNC